MVATGGQDGVVRVFKLTPEKKSFEKNSLIRLEGSELPIFAVDISENGQFVIAASKDGNTYIFNINTR
jgi:WD40 repeat protein